MTTSRTELLAAVARLEEVGISTPCQQVAVRDLWTSEDPAELEAAAHRCSPCPIRDACRAYGIAWPREVGTYGGLTPDQRRKAARVKKETAA